jgi:hypothetical protein
MDTSPELAGAADAAPRASAADAAPRASVARRGHSRRFGTNITGGGPDGNEQLTTITGTILLVMLAMIGVTILDE